MKRILIVTLLLIFVCVSVVAQKKRITCPSVLKTIKDCPLTGCGDAVDSTLNLKKNVGPKNGTVKPITIPQLQALDDYENFQERAKNAGLV